MTRNPIPNASPRDVTAIDLSRVLQRLEHKVLSQDADPRLQHSSYERIKTSANIEYARTLLLRLEHDSSSIKIQSRKTAAQTSLSAQRAIIKRLTDRLHDLDRVGDDDDDEIRHPPPKSNGQGQAEEEEEEDEHEEEAEDLLAAYDPPNQTSAPTSSTNIATPPPPSEPQNVLRNRSLHPSTPSSPLNPGDMTDTATTTGTNNDPSPSPTTTHLLSTADLTQASLTTSLLTLAQQLKASSTSFSTSLDADTANLNRAVEGLDRNTSGMDQAGRRMGLLKRMSEGKGWWGRMLLYAWIGGLWVVAVLLVGVGPKLRF